MSPCRLNLLVIRSETPDRTVRFYELLGLHFQEERHGNGSLHWAAECGGMVMEVYPARSSDEVDRATRLGFEVDDVETLIALLQDHGVKTVTGVKQAKWGVRAVVKDPDGRSVELLQRSKHPA